MKNRKELAAMALLILAALTSACASSGAAKPRPFPMPAGSAAPPPVSPPEPAPVPLPTSPRATAPAGATLIDTALSFRGTPYRNGGSDPTGFDCSGFTQWVFAHHGTALPREVDDQFRAGKKVTLDDLRPGDLVFFHTVSRGASHVGIFVADDQFVHAPSSKGVVRVESINSTYWARRLVGARRVQPGARAPSEPVVVRRRPSGEGSAVASAAAARSGVRGSKAAD